MGGRGSTSAASGLITDQSSNFGQPGVYRLYRAGNLDAPRGMVFFDASFDEASWYSYRPLNLKSAPDTVEEYDLQISNPLYVQADSKADAVLQAWKTLHPEGDPKVKIKTQDGKTTMNSTDWQKIDKQNAKALEKSGYDAIVIQDGSGHHEVQVHKSSVRNLKATGKSVNITNSTLEPPDKPNGLWSFTMQGVKYEYKRTKNKGWELKNGYTYSNGAWKKMSKPKPVQVQILGSMSTISPPKRIRENEAVRFVR